MFHKFGAVIFSTEGDGMAHLFYEQMMTRNKTRLTRAGIEAGLKAGPKAREEADRRFRAWLDRDLDAEFWASHWKTDFAFRREDHDIIVKILSALAGAGAEKIVASHPNRGAVEGFKDHTVLEYSQLLDGQRFRAAGRYTIPAPLHASISALATHQTLLGDAIATEDPKTLYHALYAYPVRHNSPAAHALYRDLVEINRDGIPLAFQSTKDYFSSFAR
jgi:alpha-galactosidase/6-phospho-beta-glucosidase family protein